MTETKSHRTWPVRALLTFIQGYRLLLSPHIGGDCRFTPTCSRYFEDAVLTHGAMRGAYLGHCRLLRCGPWCQGGHDPVPSTFKFFSLRSK